MLLCERGGELGGLQPRGREDACSWWLHTPTISPTLTRRPQVKLVRPRRRLLLVEVPVRLGNVFWFKQSALGLERRVVLIADELVHKWSVDWTEDIEETYSIGMVGERGAARFKTEDKMWEFLKRKKGLLQFEAMGRTVFGSADSLHDSNPAKTKSIRKMIRAIIEQMGGDGRKVKEEMKGTSYNMGRVYFRKVRVAEWDETTGNLILKGTGKEYEEGFRKLMHQE